MDSTHKPVTQTAETAMNRWSKYVASDVATWLIGRLSSSEPTKMTTANDKAIFLALDNWLTGFIKKCSARYIKLILITSHKA